MRIDEKSTTYSTVFTEIYINPGYDVIMIPDKTGSDYITINESSETNIMTGRSLSETATTFPEVIITAVIHEIDSVLLFEELDTR